eukprot:TRINITY_DN3908_c0_g1_i1.p3 TRINITY_DN3908_c0_g1~~TRINITY_DN3908_c0_g1_i1.p3  ORF type:complete len:115 (-),score=34.92 TRINITY_DN3908_c0_g1_i1:633-977(-)
MNVMPASAQTSGSVWSKLSRHNVHQSGGARVHVDFEEELGELLLERDAFCPPCLHDSGSPDRRPREEGALSASRSPSPKKKKKESDDVSLREALDTLKEWRKQDDEQRKKEEAL